MPIPLDCEIRPISAVCLRTEPDLKVLRSCDYALVPEDFSISGVNAIDARPACNEAAAIADIVTRLRQSAPIADVIGTKRLHPVVALEICR